jgi:hypothetical protein
VDVRVTNACVIMIEIDILHGAPVRGKPPPLQKVARRIEKV